MDRGESLSPFVGGPVIRPESPFLGPNEPHLSQNLEVMADSGLILHELGSEVADADGSGLLHQKVQYPKTRRISDRLHLCGQALRLSRAEGRLLDASIAGLVAMSDWKDVEGCGCHGFIVENVSMSVNVLWYVETDVSDRKEIIGSNFHRLLAEMIATFALVFTGCGAIVVDAVSHGQITHVGVAISFGLVIAVMIYATGHISGAHMNPAVSLAFALTRHFPLRRLALYWLAQLIGASLAATTLRLLFGNVAHLGTTLPSGTDAQSVGLEAVMTFFLMFVVMAVATDDRAVGEAAALAIGGVILLDAMFGGPISGASMNPARSFGPALASDTWAHYWVYVVGPLVGAVAGAFAYELARGEKPEPASPR